MIVELCGLIRKYAPGCRIKINTVVSALNKDEIMSDFIDEIAADRWKILRMKPFQYGGFSNLDIQVSNEEFENIPSHPRGFDNSSATPNSLYLFWYRAGNGEVSPDFNSRELDGSLFF